jgi:hypothetical protein
MLLLFLRLLPRGTDLQIAMLARMPLRPNLFLLPWRFLLSRVCIITWS